MDLRNHLIESTRNRGRKSWKAVTGSFALHAMLVAGVVYASNQPTHKVHAEDKAIPAFVTQGAAPPPPPPPPPAPAGGSAASTPEPQRPKVQPVKQSSFTPPREIPQEVPKIDPIPANTDAEPVLDLTPDPEPSTGTVDASSSAGTTAPDPAGVPGGQAGGVMGGEVGGVVGGQIGGVVGGVVGGKVGGTVGGTGTGSAGEGSGGNDAPVEKAPEPPSGPLRVGGDVKAPVAVNRFNPEYTDAARSARISGVVIIEAIIDKNGNVDAVKVIKDLPMGLSDRAADAVRRWKFKPGTLNGQPVDTIFNLTVNFNLSN